MQDLVVKAEKADILEDYGLYMNVADAIDSQAKKEAGEPTKKEAIELYQAYIPATATKIEMMF